MKSAKQIDVNEISSVLTYVAYTGKFYWKDNFHKSKIGKEAGYTTRKGYVVIKVNGELYGAGRIALALSGVDLKESDEVDHINRNPSDNRLCNLRVVTPSENCKNRRTKLQEDTPRYYTRHRTGKYQVIVSGRYIGLASTEHDAQQMVTEALK